MRILIVILALFAGQAFAQTAPPPGRWVQVHVPLACADYETATEKLKSGAGERRTAAGVSPDGQVLMELWTSKNGETFTLLVVRSNGMTCGIMAGENWQGLK